MASVSDIVRAPSPDHVLPSLSLDVVSSDIAEPASETPSPSSSLSTLPSTFPSTPDEYHDPHCLPQFSCSSLTHPTELVLYLPPLLSSLPHTYPAHAPTVPPKQRPQTTATRLPDIDPASLHLHNALHNFSPATEGYASAPYADAFNWDELELPEEDEREWYCVAFRSIRKPDSDTGRKSPSS